MTPFAPASPATPVWLYGATALALLGLGVAALVREPSLLRRIIAANVVGSAVFLLLVVVAYRNGPPVDPVPHAMVLTGIVVAVSATGLALALARRLHVLDAAGELGPDADVEPDAEPGAEPGAEPDA